jgi:hypothetical protein
MHATAPAFTGFRESFGEVSADDSYPASNINEPSSLQRPAPKFCQLEPCSSVGYPMQRTMQNSPAESGVRASPMFSRL